MYVFAANVRIRRTCAPGTPPFRTSGTPVRAIRFLSDEAASAPLRIKLRRSDNYFQLPRKSPLTNRMDHPNSGSSDFCAGSERFETPAANQPDKESPRRRPDKHRRQMNHLSFNAQGCPEKWV